MITTMMHPILTKDKNCIFTLAFILFSRLINFFDEYFAKDKIKTEDCQVHIKACVWDTKNSFSKQL